MRYPQVKGRFPHCKQPLFAMQNVALRILKAVQTERKDGF